MIDMNTIVNTPATTPIHSWRLPDKVAKVPQAPMSAVRSISEATFDEEDPGDHGGKPD